MQEVQQGHRCWGSICARGVQGGSELYNGLKKATMVQRCLGDNSGRSGVWGGQW